MMTTLYPFNPNLGQKIQGEAGATPIDQSFLAHYSAAPVAVDTDGVHAAITLDDENEQVITTGITQPDVPRALTITGNQADEVGNVVIAGTDAAGAAITDTLALSGISTVEGTKAFKTVTRITVPVRTSAGDTVIVGWGKKLGLPHKVYNAACLLIKLFNGAADSGTLAASATLSQNLFSLNGAPDGSKVVDLFYIV
jgi:hypothetical protein